MTSLQDILSSEDFRIERCPNTRSAVKKTLLACREERRPYLIEVEKVEKGSEGFRGVQEVSAVSGVSAVSAVSGISGNTGTTGDTGITGPAGEEHIVLLVPVSRLEEEVYKAEICTYLARKTGAEIILLQAHDYGSRAKQNVEKIVTRITRVSETLDAPISYRIEPARRDSDHLMQEAAERASEFAADILLLTASRDYGLDDILFGPQEMKAILRSPVPCLLVNPREDLFSLCD